MAPSRRGHRRALLVTALNRLATMRWPAARIPLPVALDRSRLARTHYLKKRIQLRSATPPPQRALQRLRWAIRHRQQATARSRQALSHQRVARARLRSARMHHRVTSTRCRLVTARQRLARRRQRSVMAQRQPAPKRWPRAPMQMRAGVRLLHSAATPSRVRQTPPRSEQTPLPRAAHQVLSAMAP